MFAPAAAAIVFLAVLLLAGSFLGLITASGRSPFAARRQFSIRDNLAFDLEEAGMDVTPTRFILVWLAIGSGAAGAVWLAGYQMLAVVTFGLVAYVMPRTRLASRAGRRREAILAFVGECAANIASSIDQNKNARAALYQYGQRANPAARAASLIGETNPVAGALNRAFARSLETGQNEETVLNEAALAFGNRYFAGLVQTYIANRDGDPKQMAQALRSLALEVSYTTQLRRKRITAISQPLNSYKMVGGIVVGLMMYMYFMTPMAKQFFASGIGQGIIIFMGVWWYIGYYLQRRSLNDRV